jgi:hypothetical protein
MRFSTGPWLQALKYTPLPHLMIEVLDDHGRPVPPGGFGEAVMTGLCSEAQPFIRYRTGDMVRLGAQLCDEGGSVLERDYARAWLPETLEPGAYKVVLQREYVAPEIDRRAAD